jgi:succinate dehydrogenase / fumarate reductase membrane anchor subunit
MGNKILSKNVSGTHHFIMQRLTSIALIPLCIWFVVSAISLFKMNSLNPFISSPYNLVCMILFIIAFLYHGMLGMRVIIEDYVSTRSLRFTIIHILNFICIISAVTAIVAALNIHIITRLLEYA